MATNKKMKIYIYRNCNDVSLKIIYLMVALSNSRLFKCSINDQMLDYNGKNFLANVRMCPQRRHSRKKIFLKMHYRDSKIEYHIKKNLNDITHTLDYNRKNFNVDLGVRFMICTPQQIFA